ASCAKLAPERLRPASRAAAIRVSRNLLEYCQASGLAQSLLRPTPTVSISRANTASVTINCPQERQAAAGCRKSNARDASA
ncbi:MAG: hypothetical protein ACYCUX_13600, partial [Metallibacterium sp.]